MTEPETVTGAIAKRVDLEPVLEQLRPEFAKVLPAHVGAERYERWSVTLLRNALRGQQAEAWARVLKSPQGQLSVCSALMDCASLGLEPGRTYHLIPFGSEVTGVTDYKGEIQLINNANPRSVVVAMLVRKTDEFELRGANVPPRHDADWFGDRGDVVGGYCYVDFGGGLYSLVVRMNEGDFLHHRDKARTKAVWDEWPEAMRLKTLVHQVRKFVPWSAELRQVAL
jgi:recombination protein RecT